MTEDQLYQLLSDAASIYRLGSNAPRDCETIHRCLERLDDYLEDVRIDTQDRKQAATDEEQHQTFLLIQAEEKLRHNQPSKFLALKKVTANREVSDYLMDVAITLSKKITPKESNLTDRLIAYMETRDSAPINDELRIHVWRETAGELKAGSVRSATTRANKILETKGVAWRFRVQGEKVFRVPPPASV